MKKGPIKLFAQISGQTVNLGI